MADLSYQAELISHYRGVRARLWKPKSPARYVLPPSAPKVTARPQKPRQSLRQAILTLRESYLIDAYKLTDVLAAVSKVTGISVSDLVSHRRTGPIANARQLFFWIARNYTTQSQRQISKQTNLSVSSSVYHACKKINADQARWQPKIDAVLNLLGERP